MAAIKFILLALLVTFCGSYLFLSFLVWDFSHDPLKMLFCRFSATILTVVASIFYLGLK